MNTVAWYVSLIAVYVIFGTFGIFLKLLKTDYIYFTYIIIICVGATSMIVDYIETNKHNKKVNSSKLIENTELSEYVNKKKPFYTKVYSKKEYILISVANYVRLLLLTTALSFKDLGAIVATYLTFPIFVAVFGIKMINYIPNKLDIAGVVITFIGILVINFNSIRRLLNSDFNKMSLYSFLYPLIGAMCISYLILISKKKDDLTTNEVIQVQFLPVIPIATFITLTRHLYPFIKIYDFFKIPYIKPNIRKLFDTFLYCIIVFYLSYFVLYGFTKKYSPLLASIISYISVFVSFLVKKYYFKREIKHYKYWASLLIIAGIILISYSHHK